MLGTIREKLKGILATVIVAILIVPFALWGVSNYFSGGGNEGFAQVNGEPISAQEYRRLYFIKRERLKQLLGDQVDFSAPTVEGRSIDELLRQEAIDEVIRTSVLRQHGYQSGYRVSTAEVQQTISADDAFQVEGTFNQNQYEELLRVNNLTPQQYEAAIMRDLLVRQIEQGVIQTAFVTSPQVAQKVARDKQSRSYDYIELDTTKFSGAPEPNDAQLKEFYQNNPQEFVSEARAKVEYLELHASALPESQQLNREDLIFYYEENLADYTRPERRKAAHILLTLEPDADSTAVDAVLERATALREQIEQGKSFAEVAREFSEDPGSAEAGGELGWVIRGQFDPAVEAAVYALNVNEVSEPIQSTFGVHLVQTTLIEPVQIKPFEEVKEEIAQLLTSQWQEEQFYELSETLASMAFEYPDSLEPAADMLGLQVQQLGWLTEAGTTSGLGANRNIVNQVFSEDLLQSGLNSEPIELSPDHLIVLRVAEYQPSHQKEYQQVADEVKQAWMSDQAKQQAQQQMDLVLKGLTAGEDAEFFAREFNLKLESVDGQTRSPPGTSMSARISKVFSMPKPVDGKPVVDSVEDDQGNLIAIRLHSVEDGTLAALSDSTQQVQRTELNRTLALEQFDAYVSSLKQSMDIEIQDISELN